MWQGVTSERSDAGSGVRHKKGESCQMASVSFPGRILHICLGKPPVPHSCGYTDPWVGEVVGFCCSHGRDVSSVAEAPGQGNDPQKVSQPTVLPAQPLLTPDQEHEPLLGRIVDVCHCRLVLHSRI